MCVVFSVVIEIFECDVKVDVWIKLNDDMLFFVSYFVEIKYMLLEGFLLGDII